VPRELSIDRATNKQDVLLAVREECKGPVANDPRTFSAANFKFNAPDQKWINTARAQLQGLQPGGHRNVPNIYVETKFKGRLTPSSGCETFDVSLFYMDPADKKKKTINVGDITEDAR